MSDFYLRSARRLAEDMCFEVLRPGDSAVDATMGNGYDTLRLCRVIVSTSTACPNTTGMYPIRYAIAMDNGIAYDPEELCTGDCAACHAHENG